jgi:hypothetical protein
MTDGGGLGGGGGFPPGPGGKVGGPVIKPAQKHLLVSASKADRTAVWNSRHNSRYKNTAFSCSGSQTGRQVSQTDLYASSHYLPIRQAHNSVYLPM